MLESFNECALDSVLVGAISKDEIIYIKWDGVLVPGTDNILVQIN